MKRKLALLRTVWLVIVSIWTLRTSWLAAAYVLGYGDVARRHVETAAFVLAALLLPAFAVPDVWKSPDIARREEGRRWLAPALVFSAAGLVLYWPALHVGLLSDDFVLVGWARTGTFLVDAWGLVRPVPLAIWALLGAIAGPVALPAVLHVINVLGHCANAALVGVLGRRLGLQAGPAFLAGALFLVFPLSVEPVTWAAGIFDVLATLFVLSAAVIVTGNEALSWRAIAGVAMLVAAGVGTKETGVVAPALLGLATWHRFGFRLVDGYRAALGGAAVAAVYLVWRVANGIAASYPPLTGYAAKELLSRPFGALSIPFHTDAIAAMPLAIALLAAAIPIVIVIRTLTAGTRRLAATTALWVLVAVAPLFTILFVGADLQGARYLYLPSALWAILLAARSPQWPLSWRMAEWILASATIAVFVVAVRIHLQPWTEAAAVRDDLLRTIADRAAACPAVAVERPDHVRGAYVFRNGLEDALHERDVHVRLTDVEVDDLAPACAVQPADPTPN